MRLFVSTDQKNKIIGKILSEIQDKDLAKSPFAYELFDQISANGLKDIDEDDLKGILLDNWAFIKNWDSSSQHKLSIRNTTNVKTLKDRGTAISVLLKNIPFVADSLYTELHRRDYDTNLLLYTSFDTKRDESGNLKKIAEDGKANEEGLLYIEINQLIDLDEIESLYEAIEEVIEDISASVTDWQKMRAANEACKEKLPPENEESKAFLTWLNDNFFIYVGYVEVQNGKLSNHLGILQHTKRHKKMLDDLKGFAPNTKYPIDLDKSIYNTKIDRHEPLDIVRVLEFDSKGSIVKQSVFIGIYTYPARSQNITNIPIIRKKIQKILPYFNQRNQYIDHKEFKTTVESLPMVELFHMSTDDISSVCKNILDQQSRNYTIAYVRKDPQKRYLSCIVYIDGERYGKSVKDNIAKELQDKLGGNVIHTEGNLADLHLARIHVILAYKAGQEFRKYNLKSLQNSLHEVTLGWEDHVEKHLYKQKGQIAGEYLTKKYVKAFPTYFRDNFDAKEAGIDIDYLENLNTSSPYIDMRLYLAPEKGSNCIKIKFYREDRPLWLFEVFPILENMGMRVMAEDGYKVTPNTKDHKLFWIHEITTEIDPAIIVDVKLVEPLFKELFHKILEKEISDDTLNQLIFQELFDYRKITFLKTCLGYLKQINFAFSPKYIRRVFLQNSKLTALLVKLFETKFSGKSVLRIEESEAVNKAFLKELKNLPSVEADKVFRQVHNLISNILRTNYFLKLENGLHPSYLSFKIQSENIINIPRPSPKVEIYIYSRAFEAVHLRGDKVARGGLRWSDRSEDFRTEVLGLVKAQITKNAIIVPTGSKGGFYVKKQNPTREEAIECYKLMINGMLELTDNLINGKPVSPKGIVCYDEPDPYLVVAADKGTATFSDIANSISLERGFWLGDAFASGGSAGYDHKKMGITAKGAWESLKHHLQEIANLDPEKDEVTAIGVGDMSGDVFGNGLLLSKTIKLHAAFNHMHIFLDPAPNALESYKERKRLFDLPRSTWGDYNKNLISKGGMVISRSAKSVKLTPEVKKLFDINRSEMTPDEMIVSILKMPVDFIWFGGIGTYVKSKLESHADVSDKINDAVRIDGREIKAKIIVEGANLGVTQKGRIEYALSGGRINTDFIDNSAGVNCSDYEVNIKILFGMLLSDNKITLEERNKILANMTDNVSQLVLEENFMQNKVISDAVLEGYDLADEHLRLISRLSKEVGLDPTIEFLPNEEEVSRRQVKKQGFTRPELSVLTAYAKIHLYKELLKIDLLKDSYFDDILIDYFPIFVQDTYKDYVKKHPLRKEIIATELCNEIINRCGINFVFRLVYQTGKSIEEIVFSYCCIRQLLQLQDVWRVLDEQPNTQAEIVTAVNQQLYQACLWFITHYPQSHGIQRSIAKVNSSLSRLVEDYSHTALSFEKKGTKALPKVLNHMTLSVEMLKFLPLFNLIQKDSFKTVINAYYTVGDTFGIKWLLKTAEKIIPDSYWQRMYVEGCKQELYDIQIALTQTVLTKMNSHKKDLSTILDEYKDVIPLLFKLMEEIGVTGLTDPSTLSVVTRHLQLLLNSQHDRI